MRGRCGRQRGTRVISLRDLEFLTALSRRKHFARAAEECGVSQPAFSMRIRKLEDRLGFAIVKRGNRFQGFTTEGQTLLRHALSIQDGLKAMEQEIRSARGEIVGDLAIGVIPTAAIRAARLVKTLQTRHPGIRVRLETASSLAIQQGIDSGQFEAGITYGEGVARDLLRLEPLYGESYYLLAPVGLAPRPTGEATWAEAAALPLCLLDPRMQNRKIIDGMFRDLGLVPRIMTEATGFLPAIVLAEEGLAATIVPGDLAESLARGPGTVALRLTEPTLEKPVCLLSRARDAGLPTVDALRDVCGIS